MKLLYSFLILAVFCFYTKQVHAVDIEILSAPQEVQKDQEVTLDVRIAGARTSSINYLRVGFSSPDTSAYFGLTFNHEGVWYNPSPIDPKKFLQIQLDGEGNWIGQVKAKIDSADSSFKGNGKYNLKVGRYTESATSATWSDAKEIAVIGYEPTLTSAPTVTKTPTPTKAPTATKVPTSTKSPTATKAPQLTTPTPTDKKESTPANELITRANDKNSSPSGNIERGESILGEMTNTTEIESEKAEEKVDGAKSSEPKSSLLSLLFIIVGSVLFLVPCGILLFKKYKKEGKI